MNKPSGLSRLFLSSLLCAALAAAFSTSAYAADTSFWEDVRATVDIRDLATNGDIYVGGAGSGYGDGLWVSTDLKNWSRAKLPANVNHHFTSVAYKNDKFIAVSNTIITSADGIQWSATNVPVPLYDSYSAVTYGNSLYVVVAHNDILISSDAKTWTSQSPGITVPAGSTLIFNGAAWNGARFVAAGTIASADSATDVIITSTDGKNWTPVSVPSGGTGGYTYWYNYNDVLAYGNGMFVAGGSAEPTFYGGDGNGYIYTSSDGINWAAQMLPGGFAATGIQFVNGRFFAPGVTHISGSGDAAPTPGYLVSGDGINWTFKSLSDETHSIVAGFAFNNGVYVVAKEEGIWSSPDLSTWTKVLSPAESNTMVCLGHGDGAGYVLLGSYGYGDGVLKSNNGRNWPDEVTEISVYIGATHSSESYSDGCIAYGPGGYVSGNYHSVDGINWKRSTTPSDKTITLTAYNGSKYLAVNADNDVLQSTDASTWQQVSDDLPVDFNPVAENALNGTFFLTGFDSEKWLLLSSPDGGNWTNVTPAAQNISYLRVGYGNGTYIAMWTGVDNKLVIARSTDGANWTIEKDAVPAGSTFGAISLSYGGGVWVAVGYDWQTTSGVYLVSHDGMHWIPETYEAISDFNDVLWDGTKFIATSYYDILNAPGIMLNVTGSAPASVAPGAEFQVAVTIHNDGAATADKVVLNDTLPTAASFESATASQGTCVNNDGLLSCELGTIDTGGKAIVTLTFTAASAEGEVTNEASARAWQPTRDDADADSSTTVKIQPQSNGDHGDTGGSTPGSASDSSGGGGAFGLLGFISLLGFALRRRMTSGE